MHFAIRDFKLHAVRYIMASKIMSTVFVNREADEHVFTLYLLFMKLSWCLACCCPSVPLCWVTVRGDSFHGFSRFEHGAVQYTAPGPRAHTTHTRLTRKMSRARWWNTRKQHLTRATLLLFNAKLLELKLVLPFFTSIEFPSVLLKLWWSKKNQTSVYNTIFSRTCYFSQ